MKIKGHVTIKMTDEKTGKVEKIEGDNMVTNALQYYFQDVGAFNVSPLYTADIRNNLIPRLLGGLLLLDTALTENADNIICPSGVEMVGNGSYEVTSDGQDGVTELGSWNSTESGWKSDGHYKMVWDFSKTQANGKDANQKIACVCLTSANHGLIGEGNATSGQRRSTGGSGNDYALTGDAVVLNIDGGNDQKNRIVRASRTSNTVTMIDEYNITKTTGHENEHMTVTGKIKLKTYKQPIRQLDMRYGAGSQYIPVTETEIPVPSAFLTAWGNSVPFSQYGGAIAAKYGDSYALVCGLRDVSSEYGQGQHVRWYQGQNAHVLIINPNNTVTYYAVPNPKGATFDGYRYSIAICGTKFVIGEINGAGMWFVDMVNNQDIWLDSSHTFSRVNVVYPTQQVAYYNDGNKIDIGTKKLYLSNAFENNNTEWFGFNLLSDNPLANVPRGAASGGMGIWKTTNYIATIFNLQEPVKKTADRAMQVVYDVYFSDGE